jgi:FkbM family methyltransferase
MSWRWWRRERQEVEPAADGETTDPPTTPLDVPLNAVYDELTAQIIRDVVHPGTIAIDVGAHHGDILSHMVAAAPEERHIAMEPLPDLAVGLRERFPSVSVHEVALDAEGGSEVSFHHVVSNPGYSGLRRRRYDRPHEQVELITVRTARLDDLVPADADVALIKIDVEGGELGVLQGGLGTIRRCRPVVVFEHGLGGSDFYGTRPETVYDLLAGAGLDVSLLQRWAGSEAALSREEFVEQYETNENYYFVAAPARGE